MDGNLIVNKFKKNLKLKIFIFLLFIPIVSLIAISPTFNKLVNPDTLLTQNDSPKPGINEDQAVLGHQTPQIFISSSQNGYGTGGMLALASTDEPAINIGGYNVTGSVDVLVYEADEQALFDYLTHDKEGKQTKRISDISKFRFIAKLAHQITSTYGDGSKILLPLGETGIYLIRIQQGSISEDSFVIRSNIGAVVKEGNDQYIFWGQDFRTRRSITSGRLSLYNLTDNLKEVGSADFNNEGIARTSLEAEADIAVVKTGAEMAVVPINLKYLNYGYTYQTFREKSRLTKYFLFTDRPLYRPGDTVYFKSVLRDDDDVRYTVPTGQALLKIYDGYGEENLLFQKSYQITPDGTVFGEYQLPADAKTGYYNLQLSISGSTQASTSFDVEFFRKPEYSIEVTTAQTEFVSGDKTTFTVNGNYFSGQPLANQQVKYTVYSGDYYEYQYLSDRPIVLNNAYRYGYWGGNILTSGKVTLDAQGIAQVELDTKITTGNTRNQVFSIEAELDDGSGNPSFSRKNVLVYSGEYDIYRKDSNFYSSKVNAPITLPVSLVSHRNTSVAGMPLTAKIKRENWVQYQDPNQKYPQYRKEEELLPNITLRTDTQGNAVINFTPTKVGSYQILVEGNDKRGNTISKTFYAYVIAEDQPFYFSQQENDLTIKTDKQKYEPTDTIRLSISSTTPDRDILLSLERGRVDRFQVIKMTGKNATVEVPLVNTDIPNIFAKVSSFSNHYLDNGTVNVPVSADSKKLVVNITPNKTTLGPGDNVTVNISTTDLAGNPVSSDVALWAVDKALFELVDDQKGNIFEAFWKERFNDTQQAHSLEGINVNTAEMGGCFAAGTQILMADGTQKPIEQIKDGDWILTRASEKSSKLVKAKVSNTHSTQVSGYLIINGTLKVTSNHKLWINGAWMEAGSVQIGDEFVDAQGKSVFVDSIEWLGGNFTVYNFGVEQYHTYFADGLWVHNQKGAPRTVFKDTAYWNPTIHTDSSGIAQVNFKLPDNLTTWALAAVGSTIDTKVGQTTNEVVVTKDVIVRPILPNILRIGDEVLMSALVQNFTDNDETFDIDLKFDSGEIKESTQSGILIKSKQTRQIYWHVSPKLEKEKAQIIFSARSQQNKEVSDTIVHEIPVRAFGFWEQRADTGDGPKTFSVQLTDDADKQKSTLSLALSPTILGTLPTAMEYLVDYPYGCVEQTTSRFVPAIIAKANPDLFAGVLADKDIDDIIQKGISRLASHQHFDGGWSWWSAGNSDPFITAYVVEYLMQAKQLGIEVNQQMLDLARSYLEQQDENQSREDAIAKAYGLSFFDNQVRSKITDFNNLSADILALAVMANYKNGDTNPQTNGLSQLISLAKSQGDSLFWEGGSKLNFATRDAASSLVIRAIITAEGDREIAVKAVNYLNRNRKSNYWSNTFATAQVIRAVVDLSKTGSELNPNYSYLVTIDGKEVAKGNVTNSKQQIKNIAIPVNLIKDDGSNIAISKTGDGQIYSTLIINEFHTERNAKALDHGLKVTREYINDKGAQYSLAVGDTATVNITVSGLQANEFYGVIRDELPAGMIPINQSFKNQQFGNDQERYYYFSYNVTDREVTENGMILSLYQVASGERTYSYKARVISEGVFSIPPATVTLMYAPEIYGRSNAQTIEITKESKILPEKAAKKFVNQYQQELLIPAIVILILIGSWFIISKNYGLTVRKIFNKLKFKTKSQDHNQDEK